MKTYLVILNSGEKIYVDGTGVEVKENAIYISNETDGNIAILTNIAMIVDLACVNDDAAKEHGFQFSIG